MDTFKFTPYGNVKIVYEWNSQKIAFENDTRQYRRKRIHAKKSYAFVVSGMDLPALVEFYNKQRGLEKPFYFTYDGITEVCYFAAAINPQCKREDGVVRGFSCDVVLEVEKQVTEYPIPSEDDVLPLPYGDTNEQLEWGTRVTTIGQMTKRGRKQEKPTYTVAGTWSGLKPDRDKLITLFNSHCKVPLVFRYNGGRFRAILPDKLEVTDHRELTTIVGYECKMEMEVIEQI